MEFLELVRKRKSTRAYSSRPVSREVIDRCIDSARLAPSSCNSQPWSFIVIDEERLKEKIAKLAFSGIYSMNSFAEKAPVLIAVIREKESYIKRLGGYFRGVQYSLIDIGITCEHFVLQAEEEGIGTCLLGWFNEKGVKEALGIPRQKKIDIMICMGYPDAKEKKDKKRKSLNEIRKFNQ